MAEAALFTVLLSGAPPDRARLSQLLCKIHGVLPDEGAKLARASWGVIGERFGEAAAASAAESAAAAGLAAVIVPSALSSKIPAPLPAEKICFSPEGLECHARAVVLRVPWEAVYIAAAAPVRTEVFHPGAAAVKSGGVAGALGSVALGMTLTGLPIPVSFGAKKQEKREASVSAETEFLLDIFAESAGPRLRVAAGNFDYSCLGAKKTYSSQANFRELALIVAAGARGAAKNAGLSAMVESRPLSGLGYNSAEDYERELRRLFLLHVSNSNTHHWR